MAYPGVASKSTVPRQPQQGSEGIRSVYDAAVDTQAEDYDTIMGNYDSLLNNARSRGNSKLNYVPINPVFNRDIKGSQYSRTNDLNTAINSATDLNKTGGYSEDDIGNIRERGISPIRSIYSSAQEGMRRQKALQGGYSPNAGAITAKMARESAGLIGNATTRVNADIAQMVASGKLSGLKELGQLSSRENTEINANNQRNIDLERETDLWNTNEQRRVNDTNTNNLLKTEEFNNRNTQQNTNNELNAVQGKQSLYGTTPALTQTFGNQVLQNNAQQMQAVTTANQLKNQRANMGLNLVQNQLNGSSGRRVKG